VRFRAFSYRFAEQILNSRLPIRKEIEEILSSVKPSLKGYSRPELNEVLKNAFLDKEWADQPLVFGESEDPSAKIDFLKERIGVEVAFSHSSFIGIDLLKFQMLSYSGLDKIDVGIYILVTRDYQKKLIREYKQKWDGSLTFEKVCRYLPHFRSAIQVPILVYGIEE
jgi:hypothetical protein